MKESVRRLAHSLHACNTQRWQDGLALLVYGFLAVVMTWPAAARLGTHLAGGIEDTVLHQWTFWWVKQSIARGLDPFHTDLLFYPVGVSLVLHNIPWLNIALWLPLQAVVGGYTAYSLLFIGVFALNGFGMYLLARDWTGSRLAAFIGGLIFGFWPYTLSHSDHPNLVFVVWVPLAVLYLRRTLEGGRLRDAVLLGVFVGLMGVTRWHLLVLGGGILGLYLVYACLADGRCRTRRTVGLLGLAGVVAAVLITPLLVPVASYQLTGSLLEDATVEADRPDQADLLAYALPDTNRPLWGKVASQLNLNLNHENRRRVSFLGYTAVVLALYGTVKRWQSARLWLLTAVVYFFLALGPELMVNGRVYPSVPMPGRLLEDLAIMRVLRNPHRFNILLGLPVGMMAALGVTALLSRRPVRWRAALLVAMAGALILIEYSPIPYRTTEPVTPAWYRELAEEPGQFGVLDLPMHPRQQGRDKWYMLYQITHGKALVEGHVSRIPREAYAFLDSTPFLKKLREENVMDSELMDVTHQLQPLAEAGVRYVILHKETATPDQLAAWRDWLTFEPYHEDGDLVVYRTEPQPGEDLMLMDEMATEIGLIRADVTVEGGGRPGSGWIEVDARWGASGRPGRDHDVCVELVGVGGEVAQAACEPLSPAWPTSRWKAGEVVRSRHPVQVDPFLETGAYTVTLVLVDGASGGEVGAPKRLGTVEVEGLQRVFVEPSPSQELEAQWGESVLLHGYDLQTSADSLNVTLYWQAKERMDTSYKVFVHLVDPATGVVVTQYDAVPREWGYPTSWWEVGEVVEDRAVLSLDGVGSGDYELWVGLYDAETGVRLPAHAAGAEQVVGDAVLLTTVER